MSEKLPLIAFNGKRRLDNEQLMLLKALVEGLINRLGHDNLVFRTGYAEALDALGFDKTLTRNRVDNLPEKCDLVMSIGGDGTFIKTARWVDRREVPVLGINGGHLGYLTDAHLGDATRFVDEIVSGRFVFEARTMLCVKVSGDMSIPYPYALNEVALLRDDTASMINIDTCINGMPLAQYPADGLIISTPTGSTAYNLSVGGPVIAPETPAFVVSPVAPHALTMRPIVVPDNSVLNMRVRSRVKTYRLALDGRSVSLSLSAEIEIKKAPFCTIIARLEGADFAHTLRTKLLWGVDPR